MRHLVGPADLERLIETDGSLPSTEINVTFAETLEGGIWGQGFMAPAFCDEYEIADQRVVGGKHLKLRLRAPASARTFDAILFGHEGPLPPRVRAVYRVQVNEFNATRSVQLLVQHWQPAV